MSDPAPGRILVVPHFSGCSWIDEEERIDLVADFAWQTYKGRGEVLRSSHGPVSRVRMYVRVLRSMIDKIWTLTMTTNVTETV